VKLSFSICGKHVVVKDSHHELPVVLTLPEEFHDLMKESNCIEKPSVIDEEHTLLQRKSGLILTGLKSSTSTMSAGAVVTVGADHATTGLISSLTSKRLDLTLWNNTDKRSRKEKFEVTQLPAWDGIDGAQAAIKMPSAEETRLKIILNKQPQLQNTIAAGSNCHFPVVIWKDIDSFKKLTSLRVYKRSLLEDGQGDTVGRPRQRLKVSDHHPSIG